MDVRPRLLILGVVALFLLGTGCQGKQAPSQLPGTSPTARIAGEEALIEVSGTGGTVKPGNNPAIALRSDPARVASGSLLELDTRKSRCRTLFPTGGTIEFVGKASVTLRENGFFTNTGNFVAAFASTNRTFYQVFTPVAVLGVKGTRIAFNLDGGSGQITLLEGSVAVAPLDQPGEETAMVPGQSITIGGSGFQIGRPPSSVKPPPVPAIGVPRSKPPEDLPESSTEGDLGSASQRQLETLTPP